MVRPQGYLLYHPQVFSSNINSFQIENFYKMNKLLLLIFIDTVSFNCVFRMSKSISSGSIMMRVLITRKNQEKREEKEQKRERRK